MMLGVLLQLKATLWKTEHSYLTISINDTYIVEKKEASLSKERDKKIEKLNNDTSEERL